MLETFRYLALKTGGYWIGMIDSSNPYEPTNNGKYFENSEEGDRYWGSEEGINYRKQEIIKALQSSDFMYSRTRKVISTYSTQIYHKDPLSPSGVLMAISDDSEIVDPLIREYRNISPLSPTEGLFAPSKGR